MAPGKIGQSQLLQGHIVHDRSLSGLSMVPGACGRPAMYSRRDVMKKVEDLVTEIGQPIAYLLESALQNAGTDEEEKEILGSYPKLLRDAAEKIEKGLEQPREGSEVKKFVVVTQVHEVMVKVEDDWEETGELLLSNVVASKLVEGSDFPIGRFFDSDDDAAEFQQSEMGRL